MTFLTLGALSAFGPLSMDLYLPALPMLISDLSTSDALGQLTLSACMMGLALGQLFAGPLSDRTGRRWPLLIGTGLFTIASLACAVAPDITTFVLARIVQGIAGSAGIVISRAVVRDLHDARASAVVYSRLMIITGAAPILAPLLGGALLLVVDWRGLFVVLAMTGSALFAASWLWVPESLRHQDRLVGGIRKQAHVFRRLLSDTHFVGYALAGGLAGSALFTYISMSSIVFQTQLGMSAQAFAILFGVNSVGIVAVSQLNALLVHRASLRRLVFIGLAIGVLASALVLASSGAGAVLLVLAPLLAAIAVQGLVGPNIIALALMSHPRAAGAGAGLVGALQFAIGAIVPPLVAAFAGVSAQLMGLVMAASYLAALVTLVAAGIIDQRRRR